jgi:ribosome-binding protein aMBF1 (putative translation factor)
MCMSYEEIAHAMNISKSRVQEIEARALNKLRASHGRELRAYLDFFNECDRETTHGRDFVLDKSDWDV